MPGYLFASGFATSAYEAEACRARATPNHEKVKTKGRVFPSASELWPAPWAAAGCRWAGAG